MNLFAWRLFLFFLYIAEVLSLLILSRDYWLMGAVAALSLGSMLVFLDKIKADEVAA